MICLPGNKDISGLGVDTSDTATPRPEILPGMNAAASALLKAQSAPSVVRQATWKDLLVDRWNGDWRVRYGAYGVVGLAAVLLGRKLVKK